MMSEVSWMSSFGNKNKQKKSTALGLVALINMMDCTDGSVHHGFPRRARCSYEPSTTVTGLFCSFFMQLQNRQ